VGGFAHFDDLLSSFGFVHLLPLKRTPRLAFYVLGRNPSLSKDMSSSSEASDDLWIRQAKTALQQNVNPNAITRFTGAEAEQTSTTVFGVAIPHMLLPPQTDADGDKVEKQSRKKARKAFNT
jgi:hypothetical protein